MRGFRSALCGAHRLWVCELRVALRFTLGYSRGLPPGDGSVHLRELEFTLK